MLSVYWEATYNIVLMLSVYWGGYIQHCFNVGCLLGGYIQHCLNVGCLLGRLHVLACQIFPCLHTQRMEDDVVSHETMANPHYGAR